jgi:hypothetical protein
MGNKTRKKYKKNKIIILTYPILSYTLGRWLGMAEDREEHVGGTHPKKIRSRCLLLVACCLWINLASQKFSSLVPMLAKLGRRLLAIQDLRLRLGAAGPPG